MSVMKPLPKYRDDLVELVKAYKGTIKRDVHNGYRSVSPSGKLSAPRFEKSVRYAKGAYQADKKRGTAIGGCIGSTVSSRATRDY